MAVWEATRTGLGLLIVVAAVVAIGWRLDVRLVLFLAALLLGSLTGHPETIIRVFLTEMVNPKFVVPICCSLGFAAVLKATGCDRHLVWLLVAPLRRVRPLLVPGTVLVGFIVNIPVVSQTATAAAIGPVVVPIMVAAGIPPLTAGAAVLLGASIGGELVNPGGPEYATVIQAIQKTEREPPTRAEMVAHTLPGNLIQLVVATLALWWWSSRIDRRAPSSSVVPDASTAPPTAPSDDIIDTEREPVRLWLAAIPLVPLVLLFLTAKPFGVLPVPETWLATPKELELDGEMFDSRLIGAAMLAGTTLAALAMLLPGGNREAFFQVGRAFFEGAGQAYRDVISLIVVANCFATGVKGIGLGSAIDALVRAEPNLLLAIVPAATFAFAWICGSGIAATQGLFPLFVGPAIEHDFDPTRVGAITCVAAAAGRTASPVAAVTLMSSSLVGVRPGELIRRVFGPIFIGQAVASVVVGIWFAR